MFSIVSFRCCERRRCEFLVKPRRVLLFVMWNPTPILPAVGPAPHSGYVHAASAVHMYLLGSLARNIRTIGMSRRHLTLLYTNVRFGRPRTRLAHVNGVTTCVRVVNGIHGSLKRHGRLCFYHRSPLARREPDVYQYSVPTVHSPNLRQEVRSPRAGPKPLPCFDSEELLLPIKFPGFAPSRPWPQSMSRHML